MFLLVVSAGIWRFEKGEKEKGVAPSIIPIPSPAKEKERWQLYKNDLYGYQVEMPANWVGIERSSNFPNLSSFGATDESILEIMVVQNKDGSLEDYLKTIDQEAQTGWEGLPAKKISESQKVDLAGFDAVERKEEWLAAGFTTLVTYVAVGDKIIHFAIHPGRETYFRSEVGEKYDQVLSTFQVIKEIFFEGKIRVVDVYSPGQLDKNEKKYLENEYWP